MGGDGMERPRLNTKTLYGYGIGNLGFAMVFQAMTTYLVFFGTTILKLPGSLFGIIVSLSVFWDAFSDPVMGSISDYSHSEKFGRRHQYLSIGSFGVAIFNALLWSIDEGLSTNIKVVLITVLIILVKTFFTVFVTPYIALSGELSDDYYERTTIQSVRTVFFVLGMAFTVVVGMTYFLRSSQAFPIGQLNRLGYTYLGFTTSAFMILAGLITYFSTKKYIPYLNEKNKKNDTGKRLKVWPQLKGDFKELAKNKNYLYVCLAYLSANLASAIIGSIGLHVFTYTFRLGSTTIGLLLGCLFLFNILSQAFWVKYSKKKDKKYAALVATIIGLVSCFMFLIGVFARGYVIMYPMLLAPFFCVAGFSVGGLLTLPLSMVGDTIDVEEIHTGKRSEGLYYGGLTFSYKFSQAIAIFFIGILLDIIGFNPDLPIQSPSTDLALGLILAFGCIIAFSLTWVAYGRYNLSHGYIMNIKNK